ncbi:TadE/TadG family type IV pilus assembly protein [Pontibacterium granulatum]|uniref:TadE/TadG family type IV pilus assembly protein n=1 Tax=Pontibacterium granulatum TaxID=2036029 RepID=UPI00249C1F28|nr:TadE/TadG family type IV pilus assembly protein [Pontibacterium granulatum]MDI3323799.1 TadE/TadG family type IV pilus assembly protein [Pontibacterium granulatum]
MMKQVRGSRGFIQRQKGLAAVEFTIALPVLLLLFLATAELGKLLYDYNTLTKAQRNGIRYLAARAVTGQTANTIANVTYVSQAQNLVVFGDISGAGEPLLSGFTVEDVVYDDPTDDDVRVTVSYEYTPMIFDSLPTFGLGDSINLNFTLSSSITMRALLGG